MKKLSLILVLMSSGFALAQDAKTREENNRALVEAAKEDNYDDVKNILAQKNVDIDFKSDARLEDKQTALIYAAHNNNKNMVQLLLQNGANPKTTDASQETPLHETRSSDIASLLLEKGADINAKDRNHRTPLMHNAGKGNIDVVKLLLEKKADINATTDEGDTALHEAAEGGRADTVKLLLEKGANIKATNNNDETALYKAAGGKSGGDEKINYPATIKLLLDKGSDINVKSKNESIGGFFRSINVQGWTPLFNAKHNPDTFKTLIIHGPDANIKDSAGKTVFVYAVERNYPEIVQILKDWREPLDDYNKVKEKIDKEFKGYKDKVRGLIQEHMIPELAGVTMDYLGEPYESAFEYFIHTNPKYQDKIKEFEELKAAAMPKQTSSEASSSSSSSTTTK